MKKIIKLLLILSIYSYTGGAKVKIENRVNYTNEIEKINQKLETLNKIYEMKYIDIENIILKNNLSGLVANNLAIANLPDISSKNALSLAFAVGYTNKESALAIGFMGQDISKKFKYKFSGAISTNYSLSIGAGISYNFIDIRQGEK